MNIEKIRQEMRWSTDAEHCEKDILIVVHNQKEYVEKCIESIFLNTKNFNLFLWNNGSDIDTTNYLNSFSEKDNVKIYNCKENIGFILPNNLMIKDCSSDWIILLNSDTEVYPNWDSVMIGTLINNPSVSQVGFSGGKLNKHGVGVSFNSGFNIDYVCGYCFCINKKTYNEFGLFDDYHIKFAYCEDSDYSLRIREAGKKIYACYSKELVKHYENKTTFEVLKKSNELLEQAKKNLKYIISRWSNWL